MAINVKIESKPGENTLSVLRRFSRQVQSSGVINKAKEKRFRTRDLSQFKKKQQTLKKLGRKTEMDKMIKLGKVVDKRKKKK